MMMVVVLVGSGTVLQLYYLYLMLCGVDNHRQGMEE